MTTDPWVCVTDKTHIFDTKTAEENDYFCPKHPYGDSIMIQLEAGDDDSWEGPSDEFVPFGSETEITKSELPKDDLGLCIMLLDCSGSMNERAFKNNPISKKELISKSVSAGIFSLSGNRLKKYAYILIIGFDHKIDVLIPYTSIEKVVEDYGNEAGLEKVIREKMKKKVDGATDINRALEVAFNFCQDFINSKIEVLGKYKPSIQAVFDENMMSHQVPNVRVLLFTDGSQFMGPENTLLNPSPFKNLTYGGKKIDLLMSAYYGSKEDDNYEKLKGLVSKCPRHPKTDQFFLFDEPTKVANLKGLFRMASGASGFCPICLEEASTVTRNT